MFICCVCEKPSARNESPKTVVLEGREVEYVLPEMSAIGWEIKREGTVALSHGHTVELLQIEQPRMERKTVIDPGRRQEQVD